MVVVVVVVVVEVVVVEVVVDGAGLVVGGVVVVRDGPGAEGAVEVGRVAIVEDAWGACGEQAATPSSVPTMIAANTTRVCAMFTSYHGVAALGGRRRLVSRR